MAASDAEVIRFVIVMGVSGCGKTSVGRALSARLGWEFVDADDFHPPRNIARMAAGTPLTDEDRSSWLASLHELIADRLKSGPPAVLACSALKESYRQRLMVGSIGVALVYLRGSFNQILERMSGRSGHYMKPEMLKSQFEALEEPSQALTVDITPPVEQITAYILRTLFQKE